jgi:outer membrane PBP1 activator LpoA protein
MPPIVISQNENDEPKVVVNTYHRIWISLNRQLIAGILENMQEKMDMILTGYLKEQREFEKEDLEMMNDG